MADDVEIHLCGPGDDELFRQIADDVFDDPIEPEKLARYLTVPNHHLFVAIEKGIIVGQLTALSYEHPENRPGDLFIDEVGVAEPARRRGVATRLMQAAFALGRERGCRDAWLGTEVENLEARAFYESLGQKGEPVIYFNFRL
jgi:ribosomal protein S18 acetylase RimI-like enzyme